MYGSSSGGGLFNGGGPANNPQYSGELVLNPPDFHVTTLMYVEFRSATEE
jgi:hypothetical protein